MTDPDYDFGQGEVYRSPDYRQGWSDGYAERSRVCVSRADILADLKKAVADNPQIHKLYQTDAAFYAGIEFAKNVIRNND